jgi:hypothetical protein
MVADAVNCQELMVSEKMLPTFKWHYSLAVGVSSKFNSFWGKIYTPYTVPVCMFVYACVFLHTHIYIRQF